eukprot:Opistho-2@48166
MSFITYYHIGIHPHSCAQIVEYENRIRAYSNPERVFRYFATREINGEVYMTANDFVRSLLMSSEIQPEGRGIDQYEKVDGQRVQKYLRGQDIKSRDFIATLGDTGLFSYSDYLFFLSVLTTPERRFELAFKMFDLDGNGTVDLKEFQQVQSVVRRQAMGKRSRDRVTMHAKSATDDAPVIYSALLRHFFGSDGLQKLTLKRFQTFIFELQTEILHREFELNSSSPTSMTEREFAQVILAYANLRDEEEYIERAESRSNKVHIQFKQFMAFNSLLRNIDDLDTALGMYNAAGATISKADFKRAAKVAANVDLDNHLIEVVFNLFDRDGDGELSYREFVHIMRRRAQRGMDKSRDLGVARGLSGLMQCVKEKMKESKNR